ncbi:MAG: hypothetical protein PHU85_20060, partial [Phycisphaerae bacterium]|nr:hypothetical protein [Phycisphaerae bacterium]
QFFAEPANNVVDADHSQKISMIKSAAVVACLPAAGRSSGQDPTNGALQAGVKAYFQASGATAPAWVDNYLTGKIAYSAAHTAVQLHAGKNSPTAYDVAEDLTVTVWHDYNLTIPLANKLFGQTYDKASDTWWTRVQASCTLNNEGVNDVIQEDTFVKP